MRDNVVETPTARIWLEDDGIVRVINKPSVEVDLVAAKENVAVVLRITEGRKVPLFIALSGIRSMSQEARDFFAGEGGAEPSLCQALVVRSPISKVIANFFLGFNRPVLPTRAFTSEVDALTWLKGFTK